MGSSQSNIRVLIITGSSLEKTNSNLAYSINSPDYYGALFIRKLFMDIAGIPPSHILTTSILFEYFSYETQNELLKTVILPYSRISNATNDLNSTNFRPCFFNRHSILSNDDHTVTYELGSTEFTFKTEIPISQIFKPFDAAYINHFVSTTQSSSYKNTKLFVFFIDHGNISHFNTQDFIYYISRIQLIPYEHSYVCCSSCNSGSLISFIELIQKLSDHETSQKIQNYYKNNQNDQESIFKCFTDFIYLQHDYNDLDQAFNNTNFNNSTDFMHDLIFTRSKEQYEELYSIIQQLDIKQDTMPNWFILNRVLSFSTSSEIYCSSSYKNKSYSTPYRNIKINDTQKYQNFGVIFLSVFLDVLFFHPPSQITSNAIVSSIQTVLNSYEQLYLPLFRTIFQSDNNALTHIQNFFNTWLNHPEYCTFIHPNHEWPSLINHTINFNGRKIESNEYHLDTNDYYIKNIQISDHDKLSSDSSLSESIEDSTNGLNYSIHFEDNKYIPDNPGFIHNFIDLYNKSSGDLPEINQNELISFDISEDHDVPEKGWEKCGIIQTEIRHHFCMEVQNRFSENKILLSEYFNKYINQWEQIHPFFLKTIKRLVKLYKSAYNQNTT